MKKLLLLLLVLSVFASYAQVPSYVPTNGLVAYYPFNGNANDASGNGNNGVVNGATLTADRNGNGNSAYYFSSAGCASRIDVSVNTTSILNGLTISTWVSRTGNGCIGPRIFEFFPASGDAGLAQWIWDNAGYTRFGSYTSNSTGLSSSFTAVANNIWTHLVYTNDGLNAKFYQDGLLINTIASSGNPILASNASFGRMNHPAYDAFNGKLDEIGIWNRALSQSEVIQLYNSATLCIANITSNDTTICKGSSVTLNAAAVTPASATDINGNTYPSVNIGSQTWMQKNLNVSKYKNGVVIPQVTDAAQWAALTTGAWCWYNNDSANYAATYGKLYNWYAVNDSNGLAPDGWHVPTNSEWNKLIRNIDGTADTVCLNCNQSSTAGGALKETGTAHWTSPNTGASNATGFLGLPGGGRNQLGSFYQINQNGIWWSFTPLVSPTVPSATYYIDYNSTKSYIGGNDYKWQGFSVRALRNTPTYLWSTGATTQSISVSPTRTTTYYVTVSDGVNSCTDSVTVTVSGIVNSDTTICRGATVTLGAATVNVPSTDVSGNAYSSVNIGSQTWSSKNLTATKYKNGVVIPQITDSATWRNLTSAAWCWFNNDSATYSSAGKLYNWYAVNDSRGIAPDGWHVPTDGEWNKMIKYLDPLADTVCGGCAQSTLAGGALKQTGTVNWLTPNGGATNSSGFNAIASGIRDGSFLNARTNAYWWSATTNTANTIPAAWSHAIGSSDANEARISNVKSNGYSVRFVRNATTYLWSTGATTQTISVAPTVTTTYYCTINNGYSICTDSVKVYVNTAIPSAPASITGATDICSYFTSPTVATSGAVTYIAVATNTLSYNWTVPAGVTLVSGQGTNTITVTFASTFVSGAIAVNSVNACGSSTAARSLTVYKRVAATPGTIQKEFTPTSIVAVTNVTGLVSETYRIKKVTYATSYNWSMNQGTSATITHINPSGVNDTAVIVTFANCFVRDTLSVKSVTPCSVSAVRTSILYAYSTPAAVLGITTVGGNFATCIGVNKTFTAVRGTPTTLQSPITSFRWTRPANTTIVSATSDSASITVSFNVGYTGGSIGAKAVSSCGTIGTTASTAILQFLPPGVLSIASSTGAYNACIGNSITYSALVSAPSTSQVAASLFRWTKPNFTTITSASADSSTITLQFNTGYIGGTLSVKGQTSCGTQGTAKTQALTHGGCAAGTKMSVPVTTTDAGLFEVSLYPNPSAGEFKLMISAPLNKSKAVVKVIDIQGRLMKSFECNANQVTALGNELKPGVYMVEVRMGNEVKTVRAVRF